MKGKKFKFKKTGNIYIIVDECKFKHPETRDWIEAFIYKPIDGSEIYVRERGEFLDRFEEII